MTDPRDQRIAELEAQLAQASTTNGNGDYRTAAITAFAALTELPPIQSLTQLGRDPETARYTLELHGHPPVRIGPIKILISRPEFTKVLAVSIQRVPAYCTPSKWTNAIGALLAHVVEVQEAPDEAYEKTVRDWLGRYTARAGTDSEGAAKNGLPFTKEDELYVNAGDLAKYVRREYSEQVHLPTLRIALNDLGFQQTSVAYARGSNGSKRRTSASYYRAPLAVLDHNEA